MPKQPGDLSKAGRMLLVLSAVKSHGRATPDAIFNSVAHQMGLSREDKNLRRSIYRDLKNFSESGKLGVQYFTPDGSPISTEDEDSYNNVRVEYFLPDDQSRVAGHRLLKDRGGIFVPSPHRSAGWRLQLFAEGQSSGEVSFIFETSDHSILRLSLPVGDLPVKLLVARDPGEVARNLQPPILSDSLGLRYGALYLNHRTMSRPGGVAKPGHAVIEVTENRKSVTLTDFGSTSGTTWVPASREYLERINGLAVRTDPATLHPSSNLLLPTTGATQILAIGEVHPLPIVVLMGGFPILVI